MAPDVSTTLSGQIQLNLLSPVTPDANRTFTVAQTSGAGAIALAGLSLAPVAGAITPGEWTLAYPNAQTLQVTYHKRPAISVTPTSVTITVNLAIPGEVNGTAYFDVHNAGDQDLIVNSLALSDTTPGRFTISPAVPLPLTIAASGTSQIGVRFASTTLGVYPNTLTIGSNDPAHLSVVVNAVGEVVNVPVNPPVLNLISTPVNIVRGGRVMGPANVGTITSGFNLSQDTVILTNVPSGMTSFDVALVPVLNLKNGRVDLTAQAALAAVPGSYPTVTVKVNDPFNQSVSDVLNVNILQNTAPTLTYGDTLIFPGGEALDNSPTTFTDDDAVLPTAFAVVSQSPASPAFATLTVNSSGVVHIVAAADMAEGPYTVTIRVTDAATNHTDASFIARVSGKTPPGLDVKTWMRY